MILMNNQWNRGREWMKIHQNSQECKFRGLENFFRLEKNNSIEVHDHGNLQSVVQRGNERKSHELI